MGGPYDTLAPPFWLLEGAMALIRPLPLAILPNAGVQSVDMAATAALSRWLSTGIILNVTSFKFGNNINVLFTLICSDS